MRYRRRSFLGAALTVVLAAGAGAAMPTSAATEAPPHPTPTCAEGPERVGDTVLGTPCADRIVVPATVSHVEGGAGNDTILARANAVPTSCEAGCHLEVGSQTFEGGPGNDLVFGDRGNDKLRGNGGDDRLYAGIGDDELEGGEGNDLLSGGFGADRIDGQGGNDYVRGDGTVDRIFDSGGGFDTLSFSTGTTPGFGTGVATGAGGFPGGAEGERGVFLRLGIAGDNANDGGAALGGGVDEVQPGAFERIIGTPFSDFIVGGGAGEEIWGGGGADVIRGEGGDDSLHGGADGDLLDGGEGADAVDGEAGPDNCISAAAATSCAGGAQQVVTRDTSQVSVGETAAGTGLTQVYLVGSSGVDGITATYGTEAVTFTLTSGSFDADPDDAGGCTVAATTASCPLPSPLDSLLLAGMGGGDSIAANGFPDGVGVVATGGAGADTVAGGPSEDVLVDGPGTAKDVLNGGAADDAVLHNGGSDLLEGGEGSDLFVNSSICDGEAIVGGSFRSGERDNASWARLDDEGVDARLDQGRVGEIGAAEEPQCPGGAFDTLSGIEDLEGSNQSDVLSGDEGPNQLFGHTGEDTYRGRGGNDNIAANFGTRDRVIDCGAGTDGAVIDIAAVGDPTPIACERVREGPEGEVFEPGPEPPPDRLAPRTRLLRHPPKLLRVLPRHRRPVSFVFAANERASRFKCRLDRRPFATCRSPRRYRVGIGKHTFRAFAIDAADNPDKSPVAFSFKVVQRRPAHRRGR